MAEEWDVQICCMGAGYVGGPTMAVIAKNCPKVRERPLPHQSFLPLLNVFIHTQYQSHWKETLYSYICM